jgi:antirestriction protein
MSMTTDTDSTIRVFIAPITDRLRGRWVSIETESDIRDEIERIRDETGAEELILADAEGLPRSILPRHGGVPVRKITAFLTLCEMHGTDVARAYVDLYGREVNAVEWEVDFQDAFRGVYDSPEAYAWEYVDMCLDTGDLPPRYVDLDAVVTDFETSGEITFKRLDIDRVVVFANY